MTKQFNEFNLKKKYFVILENYVKNHKCVTFPEFCICIKNDALLFYFNLFLIIYVTVF